MDTIFFIIAFMVSLNTATLGIILYTLGKIYKSIEYQCCLLNDIYDQIIWFRNVM